MTISIGFMEMLKGHGERVAFFRPIIPDGEERENDIDFMLKHFELDMPYESCCGSKVSEYTKAYAEDKESHKIIHEIQIISESVQAEGCTHLSTFVNHCEENVLQDLQVPIQNEEKQIYLFPKHKELNMPTLKQVSKLLNVEVLRGTLNSCNSLSMVTRSLLWVWQCFHTLQVLPVRDLKLTKFEKPHNLIHPLSSKHLFL